MNTKLRNPARAAWAATEFARLPVDAQAAVLKPTSSAPKHHSQVKMGATSYSRPHSRHRRFCTYATPMLLSRSSVGRKARPSRRALEHLERRSAHRRLIVQALAPGVHLLFTLVAAASLGLSLSRS